jgi:hypothetical protein
MSIPGEYARRSHRRPAAAHRQHALATIQELARHWASDYDWRACEAELNALPQFKTEIDGLDIYFIHGAVHTRLRLLGRAGRAWLERRPGRRGVG